MTERCIKTSWDGHFMEGAFIAYVEFLLSNPDAILAYRDETGDQWEPPRNGLDRMIDEASGNDLQFFQNFSDWAERSFGTPEDLENVH